MRRVVVLGTSGSGKTTLARELSRRLNAPHIELDALYWGPKWTPCELGIFRERVRSALAQAGDGWIVCGNYRVAQDAIWPLADTAIWLDYSMRIAFIRVFLRTIRRSVLREALWSNNHESLRGTFFSRESILLWVINTWRIRRRDYPKELADPRWRHLRVRRFRSPQQTERWLSHVKTASV